MDELTLALGALAAAVGVVLAGIVFAVARVLLGLRPMLTAAVEEWVRNLLIQRLVGATGRVAGEIVATSTNGQLTEDQLAGGAQTLRDRLPDDIAKLGVSDPTLRGMVAGELGKLGQAVVR